jgi:hypothetical protein
MPEPFRVPPLLPLEIAGGGGTTLLRSAPGPASVRTETEPFAELTLGGGGTTSCVPKSLPIMLLITPVFVVVGGGGMTVVDGAVLPLSRRRKSRIESGEGGGAITEGAGRFSFAVRELSRSGAETGGGTTVTLFICTREGDTSRLATEGAGGITLPLNAGAERDCSRDTRVGAGATMFVLTEGAAKVRSRETLGAGAMMLASRRGVYNVCSDRTLGAGGTISAFSAGAVRARLEDTLGAGGTIDESSENAARD